MHHYSIRVFFGIQAANPQKTTNRSVIRNMLPTKVLCKMQVQLPLGIVPAC
jgi:hypothetical protein